MVYYLLDYLIINYFLENIVLFDAISTIKRKNSFEKIRVVAFATKKGLEMLAAGENGLLTGPSNPFQKIFTNFWRSMPYTNREPGHVYMLSAQRRQQQYTIYYIIK